MSQVMHLTGVLDDGSARAASTPVDTGKTISFPLCADVQILVSVVNNAGVPVPLAAPTTLILTVDRSLFPRNPVPAIYKGATLHANSAPTPTNVATFTILDTDTVQLSPGRYWYDVWLNLGGLRYQVVRASAVHLMPGLSGT